jgi:hypothetical protein
MGYLSKFISKRAILLGSHGFMLYTKRMVIVTSLALYT